MTNKQYWYWFTSLLRLTRQKQKKLLDIAIHPRELFHIKAEVLQNFLSKNQYQLLLETRDESVVKRSYDRLQKESIAYILKDEVQYPEHLKNIVDYPYGIFRKGNEVNSPLKIAIVGARRPSAYGIQMAEYFGKYLASKGVMVVSGLAMGIDARAHIGAIKGNGITAGVLGCGINKVYPASNRKIYQDVLEQGCIYSEYGLDVEPLGILFPPRNRIISGICDGVLVIEAKKKSGSLITADCALEQNRDVFAVPGNINSPLSHGCNHLITQGAKLVESPEDILDEYKSIMTIHRKVSQFPKNVLDSREKMVYDILSLMPLHLEEIISRLGIPVNEGIEILYILESKGYIEQTSRNYYIKKIL